MNLYLFRRIRGPVYLLCFAVTAILAQWHILGFARSWPLYLLAAGLLHGGEALASAGGRGMMLPLGGRPFRPRTLTGAAVELLVGVFALLLTTGVLSFDAFWEGYGRWWPLLLVLLGLFLLLERLLDRRDPGFRAQYGTPGVAGYPRRRSGAGVPLVIFLVLLGVLSHRARGGGLLFPHSGWGWNGDWNFDGEQHVQDVHLEQPFPADGALVIDNARGDVDLAPSADGSLHVDAHQVAHGPERSAARAFVATRPVLSLHGASATLTVPGHDGVAVRLVLAVPRGVLCTVRTTHGDVAASGLERALEVKQDHGDVTLSSLRGAVHLVMNHGDVHARTLAGDLVIEGQADDISAADVHGKALLHGEFFGDTELDSIAGAVEFHTPRTSLDVGHLSGDLSIDGDDLRIAGADGGLALETRSKDIDLTDLSGDARVSDSNGNITVALKQPVGTLTLNNNTGDITLSAPARASFSLQGQTGADDEISSEWAFGQTAGGGGKTIRGQAGVGGPHIEIKTDHGDLALRRSGESPDGPRVASGHAAHERRLQTEGEPPAPAVQ